MHALAVLWRPAQSCCAPHSSASQQFAHNVGSLGPIPKTHATPPSCESFAVKSCPSSTAEPDRAGFEVELRSLPSLDWVFHEAEPREVQVSRFVLMLPVLVLSMASCGWCNSQANATHVHKFPVSGHKAQFEHSDNPKHTRVGDRWVVAQDSQQVVPGTCGGEFCQAQHRGTSGEVSMGARTDDEHCGQWCKRRGAQVFGPGCVACGQDRVVEQCSSFARFEAVILGMHVLLGVVEQ